MPLFQTGTLISIMEGVIYGETNFETLSLKGDTSLGTVNGIDGEMIAIDNQYFRIDSTGKANLISPETLTPFAVVPKFKSDVCFELGAMANLQELEEALIERMSNKNIFLYVAHRC